MSYPSEAPTEQFGGGGATEPAEARQPEGEVIEKGPFRSVPAADWVRDGVAAVLLYASLTRPWDTHDAGQARIEVLVITVLSMVSLVVPYLARIGALPRTWTVARTRAARLLLNAPYIVLTLVYLVFDITHTVSGLGAAMALGFAGALLAAAPRECEIAPADRPEPTAGNWWIGFNALAVLTLVGALAALVWGMVEVSGGEAKTLVAVQAVFLLAVVGLPAVGVMLRNPSARLVVIGLGLLVVVALYKGIVSTSMNAIVVASSRLEFGGTDDFGSLFVYFFDDLRAGAFGLVLVPALGALAAAAPVGRAMRAERPAATWQRAAVLGFVLTALCAAVVLIWNIVVIGFNASDMTTSWIIGVVASIVLALGAGVCAVLGWLALSGSAARRGTAVAWLVGVIVCGIGIIAITYRTVLPNMVGALTTMELFLLGIGLPLLVIGMLTIPKSVRELSGPADARAWAWAPTPPRPQAYTGGPAQQPYQPQAGAPQGAPQGQPTQEQATPTPPPVEATQPVGFTAEQARDPKTPLAVLAQIAQDAPHLRPDVAANPSTYPALLEWLGNLGDPAVDTALRQRN